MTTTNKETDEVHVELATRITNTANALNSLLDDAAQLGLEVNGLVDVTESTVGPLLKRVHSLRVFRRNHGDAN